MKLILAEKPELGHAIASAIPGSEHTERGVVYKGEYAVTWAFGHLLTLKDPEDYDLAYKTWSLGSLPIYFPDWGQKPIGQDQNGATLRAERLSQIGELLMKADCVIHAGDPDDEGQYLIDEILRWHHYTGPVWRMNTNDTTAAALLRSLNSLQDNHKCEARGWSAHARSVADKIVGYNCSRYFSLKNPEVLLTIGRVQTSTLGLVVMRDEAIENHIRQKFFEITVSLHLDGKKIDALYEPRKDDPNLDGGRILARTYAESKEAMLRDETIQDIKVAYQEVSEDPPLPFHLTKLQSYCSSKFGYEPSQVLEITQSLRDRYSAITYNRSDCQYLSEEQYKMAAATMDQVCKNIGFIPRGVDLNLHSRCFDDSRITAHTAIIPQNVAVDIAALTEEERNVYLSICKYYMVQFLPPARKGRTSLAAELSDGGQLKAHSTAILDKGFLELLKKDDMPQDENSKLSSITPGKYTGEVVESGIVEKQTKPPSRYTKASLAEDMTRIARYVESSEIRELLLAKDRDKEGENGSIGTVATRPVIIDKLVERGFVDEDGKKLKSTVLGRELYRILPDELKKPDMTAYWWSVQEDIQSGACEWSRLPESVLKMVTRVVKTDYPSINIALIPSRYRRRPVNRESLGTCPRCGGKVVEGKRGFGCLNYKEGCKFTIWKQPSQDLADISLLKEYVISNEQVKFWLASGWREETERREDGSSFFTGRRITEKGIRFKRLYSKRNVSFFEGFILLADDGEHSVNFKLATVEEKETLGCCPRCGGYVKEHGQGFFCQNYEKLPDLGCKFVIWKKSKLPLMSKVTITDSNVKVWLSGIWREDTDRPGHRLSGKSIRFSKLYSKAKDKTFTGNIYLDDDAGSEYGPGFKLDDWKASPHNKGP